MIANDRLLPGQPSRSSGYVASHDFTRFSQLQRNSSYSSADISSRFGARLRELRRSRNMTQLEMAIAFGIDRSYISDVERGRKAISLPTLEVIALGMDVSLSMLLKDI
ncbi:helix-turn-helix domain-containing protein [Edaphobacter sp. HDX4]|uniref:helix-turn-helix domain-containing protein n=1 Tax=Edaphobacter sp. HDX4 TaxID=2794064 RepID=UPI002FE5EC41